MKVRCKQHQIRGGNLSADRPAGSNCGLGLHVYEGLADARNHRLAAQRALGGEGLLQRGGARLREALALVRCEGVLEAL